MTNQPHILVVDDDTRLRDLLSQYLTENEFRVTTASNAKEARGRLVGLKFDLLVLDVMMPGEDGLVLTNALRKTTDVPILLLTAMGEPKDRVHGLESGADDYMTKPFEPRELVLRIKSILGRSTGAVPKVVVNLGEYRFDIIRRELRKGATGIHLTTIEANLLSVLAKNPGVPMTRDELIAQCRIDGGERTVDVQVTRLRRKIEKDAREPRFLHTIRGHGYVLHPD
ncbi:MAG: response regulator [Pseudomonadota bacterium]|nr:response regulator [Pseudomonadota bacterium]